MCFSQAITLARGSAITQPTIRWLLSMLVMMTLARAASAGPMQEVTVFQQGESGYHTFRIPTIVSANDGTLLAFAEGRVNSSSDSGNIDLVLKRSFDGGATWGPIQVVHNNGSTEANNAAPLVDRTTGKIIVPFQLRSDGKSLYRTSTDNGATWSAPVDITSQVKAPNWNSTIFGPVHGFQLERGPHAGRLIIPSYHTLSGQPLNPAGREGHFNYSDDGGVTWHYGGSLKNTSGEINPGEATAVELVDGTLYMNHRNQASSQGFRVKGYSTDGGLTFTGPAEIENQLIDPIVQGALLRYSAVDRGDDVNRIIFSNPAANSRKRMTITSTLDETITWNSGKLVKRGGAGYSDLVKTATGGGLLYENGVDTYHEQISFARFDTEWLDDPTLIQVDYRDFTAKDQRGNGINGAFSSGPSFVDGDPRFTSGVAQRFDGRDDIVRFNDGAREHISDFDQFDSFTLETVFRTSTHNNFGSFGAGPLIAKDDGSGSPGYWLRVENGKLRFLASDGGETSGVTSNKSVSDGQWRHAALVFDRTIGEIRLYLDYQLDSTGIIDLTGTLSNNKDLLLGAFNSSSPGVRRFVGDMDLARISMGALDLRDFIQPTGIPGDANADGIVNLADLQILGDYWQHSDAYWLLGDFTGDGLVNVTDLQVLGDNWGYGASLDMTFAEALDQLGMTVPEPDSVILLSLGTLALLCRRRSNKCYRPFEVVAEDPQNSDA